MFQLGALLLQLHDFALCPGEVLVHQRESQRLLAARLAQAAEQSDAAFAAIEPELLFRLAPEELPLAVDFGDKGRPVVDQEGLQVRRRIGV